MTGRPAESARTGLLLGASAYLIWGLLPLFLRTLAGTPPVQFVAHRVVWSLLLLGLIAMLFGKAGEVIAAVRRRHVLPVLLASATLIACNWMIYAWAVLNHHVIEASLGLFHQPAYQRPARRRRAEGAAAPAATAAVTAAAIGVAVMALGQGGALWIALGLAFSFAGYGLLRKLAPVDAFAGLTIESALLAPFAIAVLVWAGQGDEPAWGVSLSRDLLLIASGPMTAVPLLLFAAAAKRLRLATLGLLQYIAPTLQFLQGWLLFGERLTNVHLVTFACIWAGLLLYALDGMRAARAAPAAIPPE